MLLLTLLIVALAVPAGIAIAPAFLGPDRPGTSAKPAVPWQQAPASLSPAGSNGPGIISPAQRLGALFPMRPGSPPSSKTP